MAIPANHPSHSTIQTVTPPNGPLTIQKKNNWIWRLSIKSLDIHSWILKTIIKHWLIFSIQRLNHITIIHGKYLIYNPHIWFSLTKYLYIYHVDCSWRNQLLAKKLVPPIHPRLGQVSDQDFASDRRSMFGRSRLEKGFGWHA